MGVAKNKEGEKFSGSWLDGERHGICVKSKGGYAHWVAESRNGNWHGRITVF